MVLEGLAWGNWPKTPGDLDASAGAAWLVGCGYMVVVVALRGIVEYTL